MLMLAFCIFKVINFSSHNLTIQQSTFLIFTVFKCANQFLLFALSAAKTQVIDGQNFV